jgi:hypothetical protein
MLVTAIMPVRIMTDKHAARVSCHALGHGVSLLERREHAIRHRHGRLTAVDRWQRGREREGGGEVDPVARGDLWRMAPDDLGR